MTATPAPERERLSDSPICKINLWFTLAAARPGRVIAGKLWLPAMQQNLGAHDQSFAFRDTVIGLLHEFGFVLR
jgi:hypothetical protein